MVRDIDVTGVTLCMQHATGYCAIILVHAEVKHHSNQWMTHAILSILIIDQNLHYSLAHFAASIKKSDDYNL